MKSAKPCDCDGYLTDDQGFLHADRCERNAQPVDMRRVTPGEWEVIETVNGNEHTLLVRGNGRTITVAQKVLWSPSTRELREARMNFAVICSLANSHRGYASGGNRSGRHSAIAAARGDR